MSEETFKEEFERHDKTIKNPDVSGSEFTGLLYLRSLIHEANELCNVWKISNDNADNLNRKDVAFLGINKKLAKCLNYIDKKQQR